MRDQNGFYVDPRDYFQFLEQHNLWALPDGVRCPLIPQDDTQLPWTIAGPTPVTAGTPYLKVRSGSLPLEIQNPPDPIPAAYSTFLSSENIHVAVANLQAGENATLRITDVSDNMYRTRATPKWHEEAAAQQWSFVPQDVLKPHHPKPLSKSNGKKHPGRSLRYQLRVTRPGSPAPLVTTIEQDLKDIIRQEYLFHSYFYQKKKINGVEVNLPVPTRQQVEPNKKPDFAQFFQPYELHKSNYKGWLINARQAYNVAEYMRRRFAEHLLTYKTNHPGEVSDRVRSFGIKITSSWRNPERNEKVGGVRRSNHQFGRALDMKSIYRKGSTNNNQRSIPFNLSLFAAGRDLIEALINLNGIRRCRSVEILLERQVPNDRTYLLWKHSVRNVAPANSPAQLELRSVRGNGFQAGTDGNNGPADDTAALRKAAAYATHVHIGWKPSETADPLQLPPIPPYDPILPTPEEYRNLILISAVDDSVSDQLPVNHTAAALKHYLEKRFPATPTEIRVAHNAMEFLGYLNAYRQPQYKIRYFFSFSHAWPGGLSLTNYDGSVPYIREDGAAGPQIHDPDIYEAINFHAVEPGEDLYEFDADDLDADDPDPESYPLPHGSDDYKQIKTHQIRVSNLRYLSDDARRNLRQTFKRAEGIYIVGCRTADGPAVKEPPFCQELASLLQKTVYGAAYYSKVFQWQTNSSGEAPSWEAIDLDRSDPAPAAENPVVLIPGALGGAQYLKYIAPTEIGGLDRDTPDIPDIPDSPDLLKIYEEMLTPCHPIKEGR